MPYSAYADFFFRSPSSVVQLELFELTHMSFSKTYRIVRNAVAGVRAYVDSAYQTFDYYPLKVTGASDSGNLDCSVKFELGDLGDVLPKEVDRLIAADTLGVKPRLRYWVFRSDNLAQAIYGPLILEVKIFTFTKAGAAFEAVAPSVNVNKTGESYTVDRFPFMRGFL